MPKILGVLHRGDRYYPYLNFEGERHWGGGFETAQAASAWRVQKREALKARIRPDTSLTISQLADVYIERLEERCRANTVMQQSRIIRKLILPVFGSFRVIDVSLGQVEQFRADLIGKYSDGYRRLILDILKRLFDRAMRHNVVQKNVVRQLEPMRQARQERRILTLEECQLLLREARPRERLFIAIGLATAMRRAEILALRWEDFNLDRFTVKVRRQVQRGKVVPVKTASSEAEITFTYDLMEYLNECGIKEEGWLFPGQNGPLTENGWYAKHWVPLVKRCGLEGVGCHTLRHTAISLVLQSGVPLNIVQAWARHTSVRVTSLYVHADDGSMGRAIAGLEILKERSVEESVEY